MDLIWTLALILLIALVIGGGVFALRSHTLSRAEHLDPQRAAELREVQRQIDSGRRYDGL